MALAAASLACGALGVVLSPVVVGGILGVVGLGLGIVHLARPRRHRALAWWGLGLALTSVAASATMAAVYAKWYHMLRDASRTARSEAPALDRWKGARAPQLTLATLDGGRFDLAALRGRRVVLDFWASWCGPCMREVPQLQRLVDSAGKDVVVLGISDEDGATVRRAVRDAGIGYAVAAGRHALPEPFDGVDSLPTLVFIDKQGVIQSVLVGYHDFEELREHATAADFEGTVVEGRPPEVGSLPASSPSLSLRPVRAWSQPLPGGVALAVGDWDADGASEIFVAQEGRRIHVLDAGGTEKAVLAIPDPVTHLECTPRGGEQLRLLGYETWGREVSVFDGRGVKLWSYRTPDGVDVAHWGDLDGDGVEELIVGLNGPAGLHVVSRDGSVLWRAADIANVWSQSVLPATARSKGFVFATDGGGAIHVYAADGALARTFQPLGRYYSELSSAELDAQGNVQILANGHGRVVAVDPEGVVAWQSRSLEHPGAWNAAHAAAADVNGDGAPEWAFLSDATHLEIASAAGDALATLAIPEDARFALVPDASGRGRLVVVDGRTITAWTFEPSRPSSSRVALAASDVPR